VHKGNELDIAVLAAKTALLQAKQDELTASLRSSDLLAQFDDVVGLPEGMQLQLDDQISAPLDLPGKEGASDWRSRVHPKLSRPRKQSERRRLTWPLLGLNTYPTSPHLGGKSIKTELLFLFHNYGVVGIGLEYTIFAGGKKSAVIKERQAQRAQAVENLRRLKDEVAVNVKKVLDKIDQSRSLVDVARQAMALREESDRVAKVQLGYGALVSSKRLEAIAALAKARADLLKAELEYAESQAELTALTGRLPR
jgi:outer membrane protein TolC